MKALWRTHIDREVALTVPKVYVWVWIITKCMWVWKYFLFSSHCVNTVNVVIVFVFLWILSLWRGLALLHFSLQNSSSSILHEKCGFEIEANIKYLQSPADNMVQTRCLAPRESPKDGSVWETHLLLLTCIRVYRSDWEAAWGKTGSVTNSCINMS